MIIRKDDVAKNARKNDDGKAFLYISDLAGFDGKNEKIKMFGAVELLPGEELKFHTHVGESETYYILSGSGIYNDNGEETEIGAGCVTFTPSGNGHGLKNNGKESLKFIALILFD